jgi:hypothetical protein
MDRVGTSTFFVVNLTGEVNHLQFFPKNVFLLKSVLVTLPNIRLFRGLSPSTDWK